MSKHHVIDATIDPKRGNYIRVYVEGDDLEELLKVFCERARFVASHTEAQLEKIHRDSLKSLSKKKL